MKMKFSIAAAALMLSAALYAQDTRTLTLDEAVALGLQNSKNLKIDAAKVQEATANLLEAKNRRLPSFTISGSALALASANVDFKAIPAASGGNAPKAHSAMYGNAAVQYPIFTGGKIKYGIESAEYLIKAAELNAENDKISIAYNIAQAYNNLFKSQQAINIVETNLKTARERDKTFLKLENNGLIPRNDRLKANLQTSNLEIQLLEAQNNYNIANINLDLLLGLPTDTNISVDEDYVNNIAGEDTAEYYLIQATSSRKDLQAIDQQLKAAEVNRKIAKAENLPSIALTAGYIAANVPKVLTVTNAANIGVGIQYDLSNLWKKNTSVMQADARIQQIVANSELLNDQIKIEVNRDFQNAQVSVKKIAVYQKALEQANENYRITKNKYDNGLATMTELLEADAAKVSAEINLVNSRADAALAYKKLQQSSGIINN